MNIENNELIQNNIFAYNASTRNVLADKNFLSYILQSFLEDYKDLNRDEIQNLIGEVSTKDEVYKIYGLSNEDTSFLDGTVKFDLLFPTKLPNSTDSIGMLVNLELQKEGNDTDLKRMIYYCNRVLVSEKGRIFQGDDCKNIVKVGAIWICIKSKKDLQNTINSYSIQEKSIEGNYQANKDNYDLIEIVAIYLGNDFSVKVLEPLNILFKSKAKPEQILELLENDYGINLHIETKEEIKSMCNLGEGIYEDGIKHGIEQGKLESEVSMLRNYQLKKGVTLEEAINDLGLDMKDYDLYKERLSLE